MARIKAIYASVAAQYCGSFETVIDRTSAMLRTAKTKVIYFFKLRYIVPHFIIVQISILCYGNYWNNQFYG